MKGGDNMPAANRKAKKKKVFYVSSFLDGLIRIEAKSQGVSYSEVVNQALKKMFGAEENGKG